MPERIEKKMNNKTWIEKLLGSSWRSSLYGLLSTLGALYSIWVALPESVRTDPEVFVPALLAGLANIVKSFNTKDKQVSGTSGGIQVVNNGESPPRTIT